MNTPDLQRLCKQAEELGFNRYPSAVALGAMRLDPDGFHVCKLVLFNHEGHTNRDIVHHRINVLAKQWENLEPNQDPTPVEFTLDMRAEEWEGLQDVESFNRALIMIADRVPKEKRDRGPMGKRARRLFTNA
jgi:hypothetical protein